MGVKLERLVKRYYEALEEGKVLCRKCPSCGAIEWPPVYACNACGCTETEWHEMDGQGKLQMLIMPSVMSFKPELKDLEPYAYGIVETVEGCARNVMVRGVTKKNEAFIREHMPYPVHLDIVQRDGFKTAVFAIDDLEKTEMDKVNGGIETIVDDAPLSETVKELMQLIARTYRMDAAELQPDMTFENDLKAPSLVFVGLVAQLEDEFDAVISIAEAGRAKTIQELADLIDQKNGE